MDTLWQKFDMERRIREVLSDPRFDTRRTTLSDHSLLPTRLLSRWRPVISNLCAELGKEFGGKDTGKHTSFVQYIAKELSTRLKNEKLSGIEGAFLSNLYLERLSYQRTDGTEVESSNTDPEHLSIYRMHQP